MGSSLAREGRLGGDERWRRLVVEGMGGVSGWWWVARCRGEITGVSSRRGGGKGGEVQGREVGEPREGKMMVRARIVEMTLLKSGTHSRTRGVNACTRAVEGAAVAQWRGGKGAEEV